VQRGIIGMGTTFVKDVMKKEVITMDESNTIQDAAQKMKEANVGSVIVTKNNNPVGILTERDYVTRIASEGRPMFTSLSEVMSSPLIVTSPEETVWDAAEILRKKGIHKLPVQEGDKLVGIITATDLVKLCSYGSDSQMRNICDQILMRINPPNNAEVGGLTDND